MHLADLLVHVKETLGPTECASLEEELRKVDGVIAPRFNRETPHLLLVSYDPHKVEARDLLSRIRGGGYTAQLVGL